MEKGHKLTLGAIFVSTVVILGTVVGLSKPVVKTEVKFQKEFIPVTATPSATLTPIRGRIFVTTTPTKGAK